MHMDIPKNTQILWYIGETSGRFKPLGEWWACVPCVCCLSHSLLSLSRSLSLSRALSLLSLLHAGMHEHTHTHALSRTHIYRFDAKEKGIQRLTDKLEQVCSEMQQLNFHAASHITGEIESLQKFND